QVAHGRLALREQEAGVLAVGLRLEAHVGGRAAAAPREHGRQVQQHLLAHHAVGLEVQAVDGDLVGRLEGAQATCAGGETGEQQEQGGAHAALIAPPRDQTPESVRHPANPRVGPFRHPHGARRRLGGRAPPWRVPEASAWRGGPSKDAPKRCFPRGASMRTCRACLATTRSWSGSGRDGAPARSRSRRWWTSWTTSARTGTPTGPSPERWTSPAPRSLPTNAAADLL